MPSRLAWRCSEYLHVFRHVLIDRRRDVDVDTRRRFEVEAAILRPCQARRSECVARYTSICWRVSHVFYAERPGTGRTIPGIAARGAASSADCGRRCCTACNSPT